MDVEIAQMNKNPITTQLTLSKKIPDEKAWPELIISFRGSKEFNLTGIDKIIIYKFISKYLLKLTIKNTPKIRTFGNTKTFNQCYLLIINLKLWK